MQIVVNTRLLLKNRLEGIGWFSYQTLKRICTQNPDVHFVFLFDRPYHPDFVFSDNITPLILQPQARHPLLYYLYFQHSVKSVLNKLQPDLFLSPDGFLSLGAKCKQLPVIHDVNFLHYPKDSKWLTSHYYNYYFPRFAREASRIATVSEFSKNDITQSLGIDPSKIDVVYNGINEGFKPLTAADKLKTRQKHCQGAEYFLHVGSIHPRKNIARLIQAFSDFKKRSASNKKLVLAGPEFWGLSEVKEAVNASKYATEIIFTGRLSDPELQGVMGSAFALCLVSYYEGFGIPMVEAMAAGVPVIASNASCLPEIAGPAAVLVDPFSIESISNGLLELENNKSLYDSLVNLGFTRSHDFSWDQSANLLWKSIQKTITP